MVLLAAAFTGLWWRDAGTPQAPNTVVPDQSSTANGGAPAGPDRSESAALELPGAHIPERLSAQPQVMAKLVSEALEIRVHFTEGEVQPDAESRRALSRLAEAVSAADTILRLRIAAHSDDGFDELRNQALSDRRAMAVRTLLEGLGVNALRVESEGYGSLFPDAVGEGAAAQNRRAEVRVEWVERLQVTEPAS